MSRLAAILGSAFALLSTEASAVVFTIDPGPTGMAPAPVVITATEVIGIPAAGQTVDWTFVLADGKHVALANPFEATARSSAVVLLLDFAGPGCSNPDCVPFQRPIPGTQNVYLADENGDAIAGTGLFDAGVSNGTDTAQYNIFADGEQNNPTLVYHQVRFQVTMPTVPGPGPLPTVTAATLLLQSALPGMVPEPTPGLAALAASGALASLARRHKPARRASASLHSPRPSPPEEA